MVFADCVLPCDDTTVLVRCESHSLPKSSSLPSKILFKLRCAVRNGYVDGLPIEMGFIWFHSLVEEILMKIQWKFFHFTHHFRDSLGSDISLQLALHMVGYRRAMDRTVAGMHHPDRGIRRFLLYQPLSEFLLVYFPATV